MIQARRVLISLILQAFHCFHNINDHVSTNIFTFFLDISPCLAETVVFSLCCSTVVVSSEAEQKLIDLLCQALGMSLMQTPSPCGCIGGHTHTHCCSLLLTSFTFTSIGKVLDWRSNGPWFDPGFRQHDGGCFCLQMTKTLECRTCRSTSACPQASCRMQ